MTSRVVAAACLLLFIPQSPQPIKFEPKTGVQTFAVREPVLKLKPGDLVESRTFSRAGDYYDRAGGPWPGVVGTFHIEGATAKDTLVVRNVRLRLNLDQAVSQLNPNDMTADRDDTQH